MSTHGCLLAISGVSPIPVLAFEMDVTHRLASDSAFAFVGVGLVDWVGIGAQADLASTRL